MTPVDQRQPFILAAARTPVGKFRGSLAAVHPRDLGGTAIREAVARAAVPDPAEVDEVLMGNVVSAGLGQNIARQASMAGGLPATVGATTINKVCGASLKAAVIAGQAIRSGDGDLFVCGGVESMSQTPYLVDGRGGQLRYGNRELRDALVVDGLWCAFEDWAMGEAAEFTADEHGITREAMDDHALYSHRKAVAAMDQGKFDREIVPVSVNGRDDAAPVCRDESPRRDTSPEALAALRPAFTADGRVTAGNAPGLNDAAAAVVIASGAYVARYDTPTMARLVGHAQAALEPRRIFEAPAHAIRRLLARVGWSLPDVDLIELNEAFAAQILANGRALEDEGWDWDRVNVHGGAIALGHPLGATGARLLTTLLFALEDRGARRGIASLCLGGGEAVALAVERTID